MSRALILAMTWLLLAHPATTEPLSLAEAMRRGREQSRGVTAARARVQAAHAQLTQARSFRLPSVHIEESFIRTDSPAEAFAMTMNQERFSFADFMTKDPNNPDALNTAITRLEVSLPIFTGGELSGRIGQARAAVESADATARWSEHRAAVDAARAWVQLAQAREYAALLEQSRKTVQAHVDLAASYVEQGMLVASELARARVELARVDDMLTEAQGRARVAEANLAFQLAMEQGTAFELAALGRPPAVGEAMETWLATASERRDVEAARAMLRAGELEQRVRRAAFLPRVGVVARGDLVDDRLFGSNGRSTTIMAQARLNLFAGGGDRAAIAAARHDVEAGREDVRQFEEGVQLEVRQAYEEAASASARQVTAGAALAAARDVERITEERFRSGVVRMLDLLDASNARREAETRELVARAQAHEALLRLALAAGRAPESVLGSS